MPTELDNATKKKLTELNKLIKNKAALISSGDDNFTRYNEKISALITEIPADDLFGRDSTVTPPLEQAIILKDHKTVAEIIDKDGVTTEHFLQKFDSPKGKINYIDLAIDLKNQVAADNMLERLDPKQKTPYEKPPVEAKKSGDEAEEKISGITDIMQLAEHFGTSQQSRKPKKIPATEKAVH